MGWHLLSRKAEPDGMDAGEEKQFASKEWQHMPAANKGISALRRKVSSILVKMIRLRIPAASTATIQQLERHRKDLRDIGEALPADEAQRCKLLQSLAEQSQNIVSIAQIDSYEGPFFHST